MARTLHFDPALLDTQLRGSLEALELFLAGVPEAYLRRPVVPGHAWGVTMQLAHLAVYEERLAAPVVEAMAAGGDGVGVVPGGTEDWLSSEAEALAREAPGRIVERLRVARQAQLEALARCTEAALNEPRTPLWGGRQPAGWVLAKTVQHTWEHGTPIMQTALFAPR